MSAGDDIALTPAVRRYLARFTESLKNDGRLALEARALALKDLVAEAPKRLSPRESEILGLRARGMTRADIARRLSCAPRTVDNHLSNIAAKLGTSDPYRLALWAAASGLVVFAAEKGLRRRSGD